MADIYPPWHVSHGAKVVPSSFRWHRWIDSRGNLGRRSAPAGTSITNMKSNNLFLEHGFDMIWWYFGIIWYVGIKLDAFFRCIDCQTVRSAEKWRHSHHQCPLLPSRTLCHLPARAKDLKQKCTPLGCDPREGRKKALSNHQPLLLNPSHFSMSMNIEYRKSQACVSGKTDNWLNGSNKFQSPITVSFQCHFHIVLLDQLPSSGQSLTASTGSTGMSWGISGEFGKVQWLRTRTIHSLLRVHFGHSAGSSGINLENSTEGEVWWSIDTMGTPSTIQVLLLSFKRRNEWFGGTPILGNTQNHSCICLSCLLFL